MTRKATLPQNAVAQDGTFLTRRSKTFVSSTGLAVTFFSTITTGNGRCIHCAVKISIEHRMFVQRRTR